MSLDSTEYPEYEYTLLFMVVIEIYSNWKFG